MAAAAMWPAAAGFAARSVAWTVVYPAAAPGRSKAISPNTSSPSRHPLSPGPAPATTPDKSWHGMTGQASGQVSSPAVTAVARTCTSTSPGPGRGTGTLSYRRLAGSALEARMACMVSGALFMASMIPQAGEAHTRYPRPAVPRWRLRRAGRGPQEPAFEHDRHEQLAVAVFVEEHRDLVAVVTLHRALAPALAHHSRAHGERDLGACGLGVCEVVVAVSARAGIVLPEVGEQEGTAAAGVLGVAAHHRQPRALHLVPALGLRARRLQRFRDGHRPGPADTAVRLPRRREIGRASCRERE